MKILLADSGGTKTDWLFYDGKNSRRFRSKSLQPYFVGDSEAGKILQAEVLPQISGSIDRIIFYGAGYAADSNQKKIREQLRVVFGDCLVEVHDDLLGAARATLHKEQGIVAILGTGSASGLYDGEKIVEHVDSPGFILGDEGSGADLGKRLLKKYLRKEVSPGLEKEFAAAHHLTRDEILHRIYREPAPNHFLASFAEWMHDHRQQEEIGSIVQSSFADFITEQIARYPDYKNYSLNAVGSVAFYFKDELQAVLGRNGIKTGNILQSPMEELLKYHLQNEGS